MFTLGHTLSLVLAAYNVVSVNATIVEFLIPITILIVALFNVLTSGKGAQREKSWGFVFINVIFWFSSWFRFCARV